MRGMICQIRVPVNRTADNKSGRLFKPVWRRYRAAGKKGLRNMVAFKGRMNRAWYGLTLGVLVTLLVAVNILSDKPVSMSEVVFIFLAIPRLHDIGKSGWYVLIGVALEIGGLVVGSFFGLEEMKGIAGLAVLVVFALMIWLGFIRGEEGPNQWGEAPEPGLKRKGVTYPAI